MYYVLRKWCKGIYLRFTREIEATKKGLKFWWDTPSLVFIENVKRDRDFATLGEAAAVWSCWGFS